MFSEKITSLHQLKAVARKLILEFPDHRVFALYGKMGAGKTTIIQAICRYLGTVDNITSPTFTLINEYKTDENVSLYHFDFYRIKDLEEAFDLGYEDYFYSGSYCFIEWPEKIETLLPDNVVKIKIEVDEDETRHLSAEAI